MPLAVDGQHLHYLRGDLLDRWEIREEPDRADIRAQLIEVTPFFGLLQHNQHISEIDPSSII